LDYIKACDQQFTLKTKKSFHITFKELITVKKINAAKLMPTSTIPPYFLQAGCPSCHPTKSVKALKAVYL